MNIGNEACRAARDLRGNEHWQAFRNALHEQVRIRMNMALDAPPGSRDDAVGYARALRDLYLSLESATTEQKIQQVAKPAPTEKAK